MFKPPKTTNLNKRKHPENMEDYSAALSLILHGCKLAKELESSLENLASEPSALSKFCDEILKAFGGARERLPSDHRDQDQMQINVNDQASLHEWLRSNTSCYTSDQSMNMTTNQDMPEAKMGSQHVQFLASSTGQLAMDVSVSGNIPSSSSSSSQRQRRRKDDAETRLVRMAAPQIGNTEIPPDDGHTWRKYGQKEIMGSRYPRGYYRCTHQKLYNCPAKKQVQRLDHDPYTFEVMYRGRHTCHMSATAPSILTSQAVIISQDMTQTMAISTITTPTAAEPQMSNLTSSTSSVPLGRWLSMEFTPALGHGPGTSSSGAGPSGATARYNKDQGVHEFPVVDMADAMFNSGSSSTSNSMDFLFPSLEDHKNDNK